MYSFTIKKNDPVSLADTGCRFLQSPFWAAFKGEHGWNPLRFSVSVGGDAVYTFDCSVLVRTFGKAGIRFSLAYIPMMPELHGAEISPVQAEHAAGYAALLSEFAYALRPYLPAHTLCVRFDPPIDFLSCEDRAAFTSAVIAASAGKRLVKNKVDIQPPDTVLLNLNQTPDEMLEHMKSKWRYNIHLAEKKGVTVRAYRAGDPEIESALTVFYGLYRTTAERDGIAIHSLQYYRDLLALSAAERKQNDAPLITLYIASHETDSLAAIITLFSKREAVYLYGASSNVKRNMMPAYLLQWTAINDAKRYGSPVYDFYGMPPTDDKNHPMYGLYLFKTGFGGTIIHRPGSFDVPLDHLYSLYTNAEDVRAFYHKRIKKIFAGRTR